MLKKIRNYILIAALLGLGYILASQHIIINNRDFSLLKKSYLTFEYTFYNLTDKDPEDVMEIELLRDAGIGDLLVELGMLTQSEKDELERQYEYESQ